MTGIKTQIHVRGDGLQLPVTRWDLALRELGAPLEMCCVHALAVSDSRVGASAWKGHLVK